MKKKHALTVVGALLLIGGAALSWPFIATFFASSDCVSSGGSYDYSAGLCDFQRNHSFVPFYRTWSFWVAALAFISGGLAINRGAANNAA